MWVAVMMVRTRALPSGTVGKAMPVPSTPSLNTGTAVQTIAGDGTSGYRDGDDPLTSELYGIEGLAVVPDGSMVYVADGSRGTALPYNRIRQIHIAGNH